MTASTAKSNIITSYASSCIEYGKYQFTIIDSTTTNFIVKVNNNETHDNNITSLMNNNNRVHCDLGCSYEEAMTCCAYALQIKNDLLGKSHIDVAKILTIIAEIHLLKKDHDDALTISNQAINIASSLESNDDENRLVVASALGIIGKSYERLDKLEDAMTNNKKALKIKVNVLGFEHPSVASTLRNIAPSYCEDKRFEEAITMCTEALRMSNTPGNNNNKGLADALNNLGR